MRPFVYKKILAVLAVKTLDTTVMNSIAILDWKVIHNTSNHKTAGWPWVSRNIF